MSDPEFDLIRPINGTCAAQRAQLVNDATLRRLLLWIQGRSIRAGGLADLARELLDRYPENIEWPDQSVAEETYHIREASGLVHRADTVLDHMPPVGFGDVRFLDEAMLADVRTRDCRKSGKPRIVGVSANDVANARDGFRTRLLAAIPGFLTTLCLDPKSGIDIRTTAGTRVGVAAGELGFRDVVTCLLEMMEAVRADAPRNHAVTSIGKNIWSTLDFCQRSGELVVICGREGIGKTAAVNAWLDAHEGDARRITLTAANNQTEFFRSLSRALGVAASYSQKAEEMKERSVEFLRRTRIMLVVDEAHHVLPRGRRVESTPVLLEWLHGALRDHGVPVALVCTPQFRSQAANIQRQTGWNADQFLRRVKRFEMLPNRLPKEDLVKVAKGVWQAERDIILDVAVAFADTKEHQLDALGDLLREAKAIAEAAGARAIRTDDLKRAMRDVIDPTLLAKLWSVGRQRKGPQSGQAGPRAGDQQSDTACSGGDELPPLDRCRSVAPVAHGGRAAAADGSFQPLLVTQTEPAG